jgi:tripartite-type tricarboxylate transporter receptor subunit TctC
MAAAIRSLSALAGLIALASGTTWIATFVPTGTPRPIADKLNAEFKKALADPDVASKLVAQTVEPMHMSPEEFAKQVKFDYDRLREVVKLSGARIE